MILELSGINNYKGGITMCVLTLDPATLEPCESRYLSLDTYGYEEIEWESTTYVNGIITTKKGTVKIPRTTPDFDIYIN